MKKKNRESLGAVHTHTHTQGIYGKVTKRNPIQGRNPST